MTHMHFNRRLFFIAGAAAAISGCQTTQAQRDLIGGVLGQAGGGAGASGLSEADAAAGIRAALNNGIASAVSTVGRRGGYLNDNLIHIPLPGFLQRTQSTLSRVGLSGALDELETQLNRGAEAAAPVAKSIFLDAVRSLTIRDAIGIVRGPSNAATEYLQRTTTPQLTGLFRPIMVNALEQAGAMRTYDNLVARLRNIPLAPQYGADAKNDLIDHGVGKGLDGLFHYIGKEEAAIRANPAKRTSEILRKVFG